MQIKPCPFCGGKAEIDSSGTPEYHGHEHQQSYVSCTSCGCEIWSDAECSCHHDITAIAIDKWNSRVEPNPSEADRWLKEATEQSARAELAEMQRDELSEALEQARRMLAYSGKLQ